MSSARAMATFFAGVIRSSPYKIIEWEISIIKTVDVCDLNSLSITSRSCSVIKKFSTPWLICAFLSESVTEICSSVSPNSYSLRSVVCSSPRPLWIVLCSPFFVFFNFPKISSNADCRSLCSLFALSLISPFGPSSVM